MNNLMNQIKDICDPSLNGSIEGFKQLNNVANSVETIDEIITDYNQKRDLLLRQMAEDHFMTLKLHSHHSSNEALKGAIRIMLLRFHIEMTAINNNQKVKG